MSRSRRFDWLFRPQLADEDMPLSAEARFAEALAELPAVERSALALSEIGGLDTNEIAERLGTDPAVVRKLLFRARESVRTSLAVRGRRGLSAILPFQNLWQVGSSGPAVRAAGVVVAAIIAPTVVIGGAAADAPSASATSADPPRARALDWSDRRTFTSVRVRIDVATTAAAAGPSRREPLAAGRERRSVRPGVGLQRDRDAAAAAPVAQQPWRREPAAAEPEHPLVPAAEQEPAPTTVARTVAATAAETLPLPPMVASAPPVELPVEPPPLPAVPAPEPALPPLPPPALPAA